MILDIGQLDRFRAMYSEINQGANDAIALARQNTIYTPEQQAQVEQLNDAQRLRECKAVDDDVSAFIDTTYAEFKVAMQGILDAIPLLNRDKWGHELRDRYGIRKGSPLDGVQTIGVERYNVASERNKRFLQDAQEVDT